MSIPQQLRPIKEKVFSVTERQYVRLSISELITKGAIVECKPVKNQFISNIFLVPKPDKTYRLILNLKSLNKFVKTEHFKLEDHKTAIRLIEKGCFMATLDLKDAYYLIAVHNSYRKFLRFQFGEKLFQFTCLPFGLCSAPFVFTKLLKPVMFLLRKKGLRSVVYLDEFLLLGNNYNDCFDNIDCTRNLLEALGFIMNDEKCTKPSKICKFLGFVFDS